MFLLFDVNIADLDRCIATNNKPCIFPFYYDGKKITKCRQSWKDIKPWCATDVDENNNYISDRAAWHWCPSTCKKG